MRKNGKMIGEIFGKTVLIFGTWRAALPRGKNRGALLQGAAGRGRYGQRFRRYSEGLIPVFWRNTLEK